MIKDGISDAQKICIVGASYGGYAALMGAVKTPGFYQCAISVAGVGDVFQLVRSNRDFPESYNISDEQVGKLGSDLKDISPVNHADKIQISVLLIHGDADRQVPAEHSERMYKALQGLDKPVTYITLADEDHCLANEDNRLQDFFAMDQFLNQHLPIEPHSHKR